MLTKEINILQLNIKNFGYEIARQLQPKLAAIDVSEEPRYHGLVSKPTTQADIESPWFRYWCAELKAAPIYHRKLWEFAFILQVLFEHHLLREGVEGIGFGCGKEPLASLFASKRMKVCVTDLEPEKVVGLGWAETGQHTSSREHAFHRDIVTRSLFDEHVRHQYVDMNRIPKFDKSFDFCWSVCALEHLGSIQHGIDFIERSLSLLKPGGIAVHTTEYNFLSQEKTIDNWPTVLFLKKHFEQLAEKLSGQGHRMLGPDFGVGQGVLDRFIDVPPYAYGEGWYSLEQWGDPNQSAHLKLSVDGFPCTCFGMIVKRAG
jgi:2-polyprenyl-3-methyl-5-hydroxy-6-metoxy-1,4-benzoquinol methylase